jgi:hypothetical protein
MTAANAPATTTPDSAEADPELLVRDLLVTAAWTLAAAVRSSRLIAADVDAIAVVNAALAKADFGYRVRPLH